MSISQALRSGVGAERRPLSRTRQSALSVTSIVLLILLWVVGGASTRFIPPITEVFAALPEFLSRGDVWEAIVATTLRVIGSLAIAVVVGFAAAVTMRRDWFWGRVVAVFVGFAMTLPSTIAALLALYIFRREPIGVYVVVAFITFPFVATLLREGLRNLNHGLQEMGEVYHLGTVAKFRQVILPQLTPYFLASLRNEYAHAWKVVVLAELFAVSSGMGWQFAQAFDRFLLIEVLLWLLVFVAILLGSEYLVIRPIERFVLRWRTT